MSKLPRPLAIAVALTLLAGCGGDKSPGFRDCTEWKTTQNRRQLEGTIHQRFSGWIEGAQRVVSSPPGDYRPHGYVIATDEDPFVALGVAGCALDADGNLWRLSTHFSIRKNATAPIPVSTCDASSWPCEGNSTPQDPPPTLIEGYSVLCMKADCTQGEWETFDTLWDLNPYSGGGEVTEWSSSPPLHLTASVTLVPPITAFSDDPTVIDVDVTFPEP